MELIYCVSVLLVAPWGLFFKGREGTIPNSYGMEKGAASSLQYGSDLRTRLVISYIIQHCKQKQYNWEFCMENKKFKN